MISVIQINRINNGIWNTELNFYHIGLSNIDLSSDKRFSNNSNRKNAKLLEVISFNEAKQKYKLNTYNNA